MIATASAGNGVTATHHNPSAEPQTSQPITEPPKVSPFRNIGTWSPEKAREMAAKGRASRTARAEAARLAALTPQPTATTPIQQPNTEPADPRLMLVTEQIALTRNALNSTLEAKDRAQLVRALCGLLDRERVLRGEPLPGSLKPTAPSVRRSILHPAPSVQPPASSSGAEDKEQAG